MEELRVENIERFNSNSLNIQTLDEFHAKENCIDSDLKTKCKSTLFENPDNPSGLKLQVPNDVEIKSVTIYSPLEDTEYEPAGHLIRVQTN